MQCPFGQGFNSLAWFVNLFCMHCSILSWILWILRNCSCLVIICNPSCIHWLIVHCQVLTFHLSRICQKASQFFSYCLNFDYVKPQITTIHSHKATYNSQIHGPSIGMIFFLFLPVCEKYFFKRIFYPKFPFSIYIYIYPKIATIAFKRKGCLSFSTFIFWIWQNFAKYTYGWLPLEQYKKIEKRRKEKKEKRKKFHLQNSPYISF
jgi:hypothetical protein